MPRSRPVSTLAVPIPTRNRVAAGVLVATLVLLLGTATASANTPPTTPTITEPATQNQVVNAADVHMQTSPFSDVDDDQHLCTDWEIVIAATSEQVWRALCITGIERTHLHFADGAFVGPYAGRHALDYDTTYKVRARHRDSSGDAATEWSAFGERTFVTGPATSVFPLRMQDVATVPAPEWLDGTAAPVILPAAGTPPSLTVDSPTGGTFLEIRGNDGASNAVIDSPQLGGDFAARVVVDAGGVASTLTIPESTLAFTDNAGFDRIIYLPALAVPPGTRAYFWVGADGGTWIGDAAQTTPDFSTLARGAGVPWVVRQPGFAVEIVASGFQLPVSIAFVPDPGSQPNDPSYYVAELYGSIKVVRRNGVVGNYATGLLNFDPLGQFPGAGEQGIGSIVVDPASGDVFASLLYDNIGPHYPKVIRLHSTDGGLTASQITTVLDLVGELQGASHQISNLTFGPDDKLYVHVGDGFDPATAQNPSSFRGKILRVNLDGSPAAGNPFYDLSNGVSAQDYLFALGFRNPFGGAWSAAGGNHYIVENGPSVDRFARIVPGRNYLWDGTDQSMRNFALYNWEPATAPVNITFVEAATFGGSGFPSSKLGHAFVTESGPTYATGPVSNGKRVSEFVLDGTGALVSGPTLLVEYGGTGKASAVGLAAGPDGLYFTDLFKDRDFMSPIDVGANVLRIKYVGNADFAADTAYGPAPLTVHFVDASAVPSPTAWQWTFGDGGTASGRNVRHTYTQNGVYDVTLRVIGANGARVVRKAAYICVGSTCGEGLRAEYFNDIALGVPALTRSDATIDFDWGGGSPDPVIDPDTFSVRWTGEVTPPTTGTYTFTTRTDDGVRLWINDVLVVDRWVNQSATDASGTIPLEADVPADLRMEYYENGGDAVAQLSWSGPSVPKQIIPADRLSAPSPVLAPPMCGAAPAAGCRLPALARKSSLVLKNAPIDTRDHLIWRWLGGAATSVAEFETPLATASYSLCVYDGNGTLLQSSGVRAGGVCGSRRQRSCWRTTGRGFEFRDSSASRDGITRMTLIAGPNTKAKILVNGTGPALQLPALPVVAPVRVQLLRNGGQCWEARYSAPVRNDAQQLKARAD